VLREVVGFIVWIIANVMYIQFRKDGLYGFRRLVAFWLGFPVTVLSVFGVRGPTAERRRELSQEARSDDDLEAELLAEIRRDRASRRLDPGAGEDIQNYGV
jgi:hypothetical protein